MRIIGISGKARSGKDTIAGHLIQNHGFVRRAFADPLKDAARTIFHFTDEQLYGDLKETVDPFWNMTPRRVMQLLGTEAVRKNIDDNVWIKSMERWLSVHGKERVERSIPGMDIVSPAVTAVAITDVRFPNEAKAIKSWGGEVWRVERPGAPKIEQHASETALDDYPAFDFVIQNNSTLENLFATVDLLVRNRALRRPA